VGYVHDAALRTRILSLLSQPPSRPAGSFPGAARWSWTRLRQAVGGSVSASRFRRVIDELIEDSELIELHELTGNYRRARHVLVLPEQWGTFVWGDLLQVSAHPNLSSRLGIANPE
jgi:hypothetical protein